MHWRNSLLSLITASAVVAYTPCPLLGLVFEPPVNLSDASPFQDALQSLKATLDKATQTGKFPYGSFATSNNSFSVGIFDATSPGQLFSYQYTSPQIRDSKQGATNVTEDSVYRIGSLSKLITIYLFLIEVGPTYWSRPITDFVPELATAAKKCSALEDPVDCTDWTEITLGALASHMGGVPRDYSTPAELLDPLTAGEAEAVAVGFPPLPNSALPPCGLGATDACSEGEYLQGYTAEQPIVAPFTSPIYCNGAFELIAFALENITGRSIPEMLKKDLFSKLNMTSSSYYNPTNLDNAVIPINLTASYFGAILGNETPVGGYFSTQSDLARLGQSILASTLLKPAVTRQWMKPVTFTSSMTGAVGMPWEIFRVPNLTDHVVDLYTKAGDLGLYSSYMVLSPDYNVGFIVLVAGGDTTSVAEFLSDTIAATIIPTLENTARQQSHEMFAGTYMSTENGVDSKIILTTQPGKPGLKVETWINNGTNIDLPLTLITQDTSGFDIRLYRTGLIQNTGATSERIAYRAVFETLDTAPDGGIFSSECSTWESVDAYVYGNIGVDEFIFDVENGKAVGLSPRAWRTTLQKTA